MPRERTVGCGLVQTQHNTACMMISIVPRSRARRRRRTDRQTGVGGSINLMQTRQIKLKKGIVVVVLERALSAAELQKRRENTINKTIQPTYIWQQYRDTVYMQ